MVVGQVPSHATRAKPVPSLRASPAKLGVSATQIEAPGGVEGHQAQRRHSAISPSWRQPRGKNDSFFSQPPYKCYLEEVASVRVDLRFAPGLPPGWCDDLEVLLEALLSLLLQRLQRVLLPLPPGGSFSVYRGTSLIRNRHPLGPYSRPTPRALRWS